MTNLEFHKNEINELMKKGGHYLIAQNIGYAFQEFSNKYASNYPCRSDKFIDWLLAEHEEYKKPIKLKQWEYDLIKYHGNFAKFNDISILMAMKGKGHFKDMNSAKTRSMTIKEILENCEIVSDDYDFEGE